jgi:hypothetical protein
MVDRGVVLDIFSQYLPGFTWQFKVNDWSLRSLWRYRMSASAWQFIFFSTSTHYKTVSFSPVKNDCKFTLFVWLECLYFIAFNFTQKWSVQLKREKGVWNCHKMSEWGESSNFLFIFSGVGVYVWETKTTSNFFFTTAHVFSSAKFLPSVLSASSSSVSTSRGCRWQ